MKILIIGGGNMGQTYAQSFLAAKIIEPENLTILEHLEEKVAMLKAKGFDNVITDPGAYVSDVDLVVLAVKPQDIPSLFPRIRSYIKPDQLMLSIMAGITIETIRQGLNTPKVVRAMPNMPAQIGMGMTAYTSAAEVSRIELITVQNLLNTTGKSVYFEEERMIDAATAASGSGPAYVFYFMDAMTDAAVDLGFSPAEAELFVWQTFLGAINLHKKNNLSSKEWIQRVASRGGTTEAAIKAFEAGQLNPTIQAGMKAAFERAVELSKMK
ncbi:MAG: pyrroline-5-carboxylate reductase [Saprospiraceae bacterium]|nr:pyrroline-5-carboxylate reductase [Saprospiraceae bacterium]